MHHKSRDIRGIRKIQNIKRYEDFKIIMLHIVMNKLSTYRNRFEMQLIVQVKVIHTYERKFQHKEDIPQQLLLKGVRHVIT